MLTPNLLLLLGMIAFGIGAGFVFSSVMHIHFLGNSSQVSPDPLSQRDRYILAVMLGLQPLVALRYPVVYDLFGYISLAMVVLLPLVFTGLIVRALVVTEP